MDTLKNKDIVEFISEFVDLKKLGGNYVGFCPFHNDNKRPSLVVSLKKNIYSCFACNVGGDAINFYSKLKNINYFKAKQILLNEKTNNQNQEFSILDEANFFFRNALNTNQNMEIKNSLLRQKINFEIIDKFNIGYANGFSNLVKFLKLKGFTINEIIQANLSNDGFNDFFNQRIMFPIYNYEKKIIGFNGRAVKDNPIKYLISRENHIFKKSEILYNINNIQERKSVILVEGIKDLIAVNKVGFNNVVATLGTALTRKHIELIENFFIKDIVIAYDGDLAGIKSTIKNIKLINQFDDLNVWIAPMETNKDPFEILQEENGPKRLFNIIKNYQSANDFILNMFFKYSKNKSIELIIEKLRSLEGLIKFKDKTTKEYYLKLISNKTNLPILKIAKLLGIEMNELFCLARIKEEAEKIGNKKILGLLSRIIL